jgi:hypothetical protein
MDIKPEKKVLGEKKRAKLKKGAKFDVDFLELATRLVASGMDEKTVGYFIGCTEREVKGLKRKDPMFKRACEEGKQLALSYLIAQGLRAAAGYDYTEKNIKVKRKLVKVKDEEGKVTEELLEYPAEESTFVKHQAPDKGLLMFLITNMSRQLGKEEEERWLSQHRIEIDEQKNVNIKISGDVAVEQIERLAGAFMNRKIIDAKVTDASDAQDSGGPRRSIKGNTKTHK